MIDILIDTLLDILKLLPFLFIAFLIIELIEHNLSDKSRDIISKSGKFGPIIGSLLGAIPQCGFSVIATNLYVTRIISLGTLIAIYLSTSDEMLPILITSNAKIQDIIFIILTKVIIGMICGILIDLIIRKKNISNFNLCEDDECDCEHSILKSTLIHTLKTTLFIGIITLVLNIIFYYFNDIISSLLFTNKIVSPLLSSLIGLIPNCGSSIIITQLYLKGIIYKGTLIGGLLTGSGVSLLVLFKTNKNIKENILILSLIYIIGIISGIIINLVG
jgi:hypothetical protein